MPRVTSRDVARAAGVSQYTVSKVIHNSPHVRPETRAAVETAMKELGYHPNAVATALRTRTTSVIMFVVRRNMVNSRLTAELLAGAIQGANEHEHSVLVVAVDGDSAAHALHTYRTGLVSGALVFAICANDPIVTELASDGCPTISLTQPSESTPEQRSIRADDAGGARAAMRHLLDQGHTHIGILGVGDALQGLDYDRGHAAMAEAQRASAKASFLPCHGWSMENGMRGAAELFRMVPRVTAIFAISDRLAFGALAAAAKANLRIPQDLAVVGFDNAEWSAYCTPPLTTVDFPLHSVGRVGAERLLTNVHTPTHAVPTRLIVRASSGR